jgi:hypothetical protein
MPLSHAVVIPSPQPHTRPSRILLRSGSLVRRAALGHAGLAVFGIAMALASREPFGPVTLLRWALLLPATLSCAAALCLPAVYVPWTARNPRVRAGPIGRAGVEALASAGAGAASTAPILWFFAVTAPDSSIVVPLGSAFIGLALFAGGAAFVRALDAAELHPREWALAGAFSLFVLTFLELADAAGLRWMGV